MPSTLKDFMDSPLGCWSRVQCSNGDPIWISVAQTGITVKRSKVGLFGAQLFYEKDLHTIALLCNNLFLHVENFNSLPSGITNPVLMLFTQLCLQCESALEVTQLLNSGR